MTNDSHFALAKLLLSTFVCHGFLRVNMSGLLVLFLLFRPPVLLLFTAMSLVLFSAIGVTYRRPTGKIFSLWWFIEQILSKIQCHRTTSLT